MTKTLQAVYRWHDTDRRATSVSDSAADAAEEEATTHYDVVDLVDVGRRAVTMPRGLQL